MAALVFICLCVKCACMHILRGFKSIASVSIGAQWFPAPMNPLQEQM